MCDRPAPSVEGWALDLSHNEIDRLEQAVRTLHQICDGLSERMIALGYHSDKTVTAWHKYLRNQ